MRHATCEHANMRHATCDMRHANMRTCEHATCDMRHVTCEADGGDRPRRARLQTCDMRHPISVRAQGGSGSPEDVDGTSDEDNESYAEARCTLHCACYMLHACVRECVPVCVPFDMQAMQAARACAGWEWQFGGRGRQIWRRQRILRGGTLHVALCMLHVACVRA